MTWEKLSIYPMPCLWASTLVDLYNTISQLRLLGMLARWLHDGVFHRRFHFRSRNIWEQSLASSTCACQVPGYSIHDWSFLCSLCFLELSHLRMRSRREDEIDRYLPLWIHFGASISSTHGFLLWYFFQLSVLTRTVPLTFSWTSFFSLICERWGGGDSSEIGIAWLRCESGFENVLAWASSFSSFSIKHHAIQSTAGYTDVNPWFCAVSQDLMSESHGGPVEASIQSPECLSPTIVSPSFSISSFPLQAMHPKAESRQLHPRFRRSYPILRSASWTSQTFLGLSPINSTTIFCGVKSVVKHFPRRHLLQFVMFTYLIGCWSRAKKAFRIYIIDFF